MRIWLPIKLKTTGGSSSFARKFKQGMEQRGHMVVLSLIAPPEYDIVLVSPRVPLPVIYQARRRSQKIIHRLDGAYYPASPAGWLFPAYNAGLTAVQFLSNYTIYQSRYAQRICQRLVGPRSPKKSTIIYNGVDTDRFTLVGPRRRLRTSPDQHIFFTAQQFRRRDQIEPLVQALDVYRRRYHENTALAIAGDFADEAASLLITLKQNSPLHLLGSVNNDDLPEYLRAADAFLHCHPNPACPNNVLEAMACGLPVVGINDGAMSEIVRHEQDGYLVKLPGHGHIAPLTFDPVVFADAMNASIVRKSVLASSARAHVLGKFTLDHMINNYERAMGSFTNAGAR